MAIRVAWRSAFLFELARFRLNDILAGTFGLIEDHYGVL